MNSNPRHQTHSRSGSNRPTASLRWPVRLGVGLVVTGVAALFVGCVDTTIPDLTGALGTGPTDARFCSAEEIDSFEPRTLRIDIIDVGQGDAIFVRTPYIDDEESQSKHVLIDTGKSGNITGSSPGGATVVDYLASHGHDVGRPLQALVITHAHEDHYGGMPAVAAAFGVERYIDPGFIPPGTQFGSVRQGVLDGVANVNAPASDVFGPTPVEIDVFGDQVIARLLWSSKEPPSGNTTTPSGTDINNTSVVLSISYFGQRVLLMGDAEHEVEEALLASGVDLAADVLKVGHHGSETASSVAFLNAVFAQPGEDTFAVISSGTASFNGTRLPSQSVVDALRSRLSDYHVLSTQNRDEGKAQGTEHGDDHVVIKITEEGLITGCYGL